VSAPVSDQDRSDQANSDQPEGAVACRERRRSLELPASFAAGFAWYVAYTDVRCEQRARMELTAKGFAVYLPTYLREIRHARRVKTVERPLFPRYLFVGFDINHDPWTQVRRTDGIDRLLSHDEIPVRVPPGVVEGLRAAQERDVFAEKARMEAAPTIGEHVEIADGPFRNFIVEVASAPDEQHRVEILLKVLGGERKIRMVLAALRRRPA